ncbi:hypothetical protein DAPK24_048340 [Pichia kluyveri]|uniref:Uncharacterized protein n=1 Tax=Pichia kluyveri TaxID=36015 RepID=A0AAV5RC90_PICKL|nr:hypothetical protein DAPK24_048340 [Pichia kluyveri]
MKSMLTIIDIVRIKQTIEFILVGLEISQTPFNEKVSCEIIINSGKLPQYFITTWRTSKEDYNLSQLYHSIEQLIVDINRVEKTKGMKQINNITHHKENHGNYVRSK